MQTTLRIDDSTYQRAKTKASALGVSLTRFFEEAVEQRLARLEDVRPAKKIVLPVSSTSEPPMNAEDLRGNDCNDAMLAGLAIEKCLRLVTFDQCFKRFPGLRLLLLKD
jgi:predicted nucleic acid-binding protein